MVFSSAIFLFAFLPVIFLGHWLLPGIRAKNALLLPASLIFYAAGEPIYVLLLLLSVAMNWFFGRMVTGKRAKAGLLLAVMLNLAMLGVFKYTDFLLDSLNRVFSLSIPLVGIRLPIGISFFTFQALSYVVDVYRDRSLYQKSIFRLALYIAFFPQLIAGPIVQYGDIAAELEDRRVTVNDVSDGLKRFIFGLSRKLLIANTMGKVADAAFGVNGGSAATAWIGLLCYCLQIYYDFSGYSDMAIGLGRMFGFHFLENFRNPYSAATVQEFWRKWHISLSSWFKNYVYIPLGGNRKGKLRTFFNQYVVFFLTGLWHGASWNFVIWGLIHGTAMTAEKALDVKAKVPRPVSRIFTLLIVALAFVFFRAETFTGAMAYFAALFGAGSAAAGELQSIFSLLTPFVFVSAAFGVLLCIPAPKRLTESRLAEPLSYAAALVLFFLCVGNLAASTFNPFIYFRF